MRSTSKMMVYAAIALAAVAGGYSLLRPEGSDAKTLVGRLWIERLPKSNSEHVELMAMLSDKPLGMLERRSRYGIPLRAARRWQGAAALPAGRVEA
jgi:hypothetical protein